MDHEKFKGLIVALGRGGATFVTRGSLLLRIPGVVHSLDHGILGEVGER
jgi:hypothetical protein